MITNFRSFNKLQIEKIANEYNENIPKNIPCVVDKVNDNYTVNIVSLIDEVLYQNVDIFFPMGYSFNPDRLKYGLFIHSDYWFGSLKTDGKLEQSLSSGLSQFGIFVPLLDKDTVKLYNDKKLKQADLTIFNKDATNYIALETDNVIINNKDKAYMTMEDGIITIKNNNDNETIVMDNKVELTSKNESILMNDKIEIVSKQDAVKLDSGVVINSSAAIDISTQVASLKEIVDGLIECINLASVGTGNQGAPIVPNPQLSVKIGELQTKLAGVLK